MLNEPTIPDGKPEGSTDGGFVEQGPNNPDGVGGVAPSLSSGAGASGRNPGLAGDPEQHHQAPALCPECNGSGWVGEKPPPKNFSLNVPLKEWPELALVYADVLHRVEHLMSDGKLRSPIYTVVDALNYFLLNEKPF